MERGDVDEAARQGVLAGPAVVERALDSSLRATRLAGIAAAPAVEDRAELLPALARVAGGADRRTAIPAALAARAIARELAARDALPDDVARADVDKWRAEFEKLAKDRERFVEVRVAAVATAAALGGVDAAAFAAEPDADVRAAVAAER